MSNVKPRYEVHKLEGKTMRGFVKAAKGGGFDKVEKEVDAGYMVYFPNGSSIRCWDEDHLRSLGFHLPADLVDMETGDVVGSPRLNLKANSERVTSRGRNALPGIVAGGTE